MKRFLKLFICLTTCLILLSSVSCDLLGATIIAGQLIATSSKIEKITTAELEIEGVEYCETPDYGGNLIQIGDRAELETIIKDNEKAQTVFANYNDGFFKNNHLLLVPIKENGLFQYSETTRFNVVVSNEQSSISLPVFAKMGGNIVATKKQPSKLYLARELSQERERVEREKFIIIIIEATQEESGYRSFAIMDKYGFESDFEEVFTLKELYESGELSGNDVKDIVRNFNEKTEINFEFASEFDNAFKDVMTKEYLNVKKIVLGDEIWENGLMTYKYYGLFNGYHAFTYTYSQEITDTTPLVRQIDVNGELVTYKSARQILCVKITE